MCWFYLFRLYGGPLLFRQKRGKPWAPVRPRPGAGFPPFGIAPWVRADRPSMALWRLLGVLPRNPLRNTSTRPSLTSQSAASGLSRFKSTSTSTSTRLFAAVVKALRSEATPPSGGAEPSMRKPTRHLFAARQHRAEAAGDHAIQLMLLRFEVPSRGQIRLCEHVTARCKWMAARTM